MKRLKSFIMNLLGIPVTLPFFVLYWIAEALKKFCDLGVAAIVNPYARFLHKIFKYNPEEDR